MENVAQYIDHTILNADATKADIQRICEEAKEYNFKTVCIQPYWVKYAKEILEDSEVGITTVIGFPLGANTTEIKVAEAKLAVAEGASDVDMVINIGALKSEDYDTVLNDIKAVVDAVSGKAIVKVIIETSLLTKSEKIRASELAKQAGADFVKTSTGFSTGGATLDDVQLMRATVGPDMGVKASGGVRTYEDAKAMIEVGATRIGASSGISIVEGSKEVE
ncbi:deoxyribose-phosphate aldolase [Atopostipes suicloacalis DSM 15692]|uniref:Deoxyribose-phosphate aldolase n=1 Tax=Atopostipes suicloacalis DSM 15692 TaxID=1121025 RepID=A0A1M4TJE9_9LACT|nr:deoxyribose-phosphate aldolase [Atopostipes suicloacalis]SHE44538.1 deoxyribose-phosphate aldolase [Atopostipes suicloacalis DSM 15692]